MIVLAAFKVTYRWFVCVDPKKRHAQFAQTLRKILVIWFDTNTFCT